MSDQDEAEKVYSDPENIYNICGRVKNHVVIKTGAALTPVGTQMCNMFTHVLKDLYNFANSLDDAQKASLKALLTKHETMPADLIAVVTPKRKA